MIRTPEEHIAKAERLLFSIPDDHRDMKKHHARFLAAATAAQAHVMIATYKKANPPEGGRPITKSKESPVVNVESKWDPLNLRGHSG